MTTVPDVGVDSTLDASVRGLDDSSFGLDDSSFSLDDSSTDAMSLAMIAGGSGCGVTGFGISSLGDLVSGLDSVDDSCLRGTRCWLRREKGELWTVLIGGTMVGPAGGVTLRVGMSVLRLISGIGSSIVRRRSLEWDRCSVRSTRSRSVLTFSSS